MTSQQCIGASKDTKEGADAASQWKVYYFNAPTRGEQVRMLLRITNTPFEDITFKGEEGMKYKPASMGDLSPATFNQFPCVVDPDGNFLAQTTAIMQHIGRSVGLAPETPMEDALALSLTLASEDMRGKVFYKVLQPEVIRRILIAKCACLGCSCCVGCISKLLGRGPNTFQEGFNNLDSQLSNFERFIRLHGKGGPFLLGSAMYYCDVAVYDCISEQFVGCRVTDANAYLTEHKFNLLKVFYNRMHVIFQPFVDARGGYAVDLIAKEHGGK
jgi:glutathione S-transferase